MTVQAPPTSETDELRKATVTVLDHLLEAHQAMELPEPPPTLARFRRKLAENQYNVLVVGEAKRGKSTFINALIGRDLLPTDVEIATSQVFRVSRADEEAYRLRFEDDSTQEIAGKDLAGYGSEVASKSQPRKGKLPKPEKVVRWIEVDVPVTFLPPGVSIIDTPGLGSLYARHAEVTHRIVPHADAVIFVLDSARPMDMDEVHFVETLLEVTPSIFFIQTKIDRHRRQQWNEVQARNEEILRSHFNDRLPGARVWPISSRHLLTAAETGDDDYLLHSGHTEMAVALQTFLFAAAGWGRCAEATLTAEQYHALGRATLTARMSGVLEESKQRRASAQQRVAQRRQQFDADWGPNGQKYRGLITRIHERLALGKRNFADALLPKSKIFQELQQRINAIATVEEANQLGAMLPGEVITAVSRAWRQVCEGVQRDCDALLRSFVQEASTVGSIVDLTEAGAPDIVGGFDRQSETLMDVLNANRGHTMTVAWLSGTGITALASLGIIAPPVAAVGALAIGITLIYRNWDIGKEKLVQQGQARLLQFLQNDIRPQVHQYFFATDLDQAQSSLVDEYFARLERAMSDQVRSIVKQKVAEAQAEITRMQEEDKLDEVQRRARAGQYERQLAAWDGIKRSIQAIRDRLVEMGHLQGAISR